MFYIGFSNPSNMFILNSEKNVIYLSGEKERMLNNKNQSMTLRYRTGVSKLDFYPFAEIKNWKNLGYWLLILKPYIDKDNNEDGILESYTFSQEDSSLEATVSLKATWQDGTPVSSFEAAMGIAKGLTYREYSASIKVKGTGDINKVGWDQNSYKGIEILSPIKFKLYFEGQIEKIIGVLEDALSFTSVGNIVWPVRLNSTINPEYNPNYFDIVSKYPIRYENGLYILTALGHQVELSTFDSKDGYDFYFNYADFHQYKLPNELLSDFIIYQSENMQTFITIFNSKSRIFESKKSRIIISSIMRNIALSLAEIENYYVSPGHFDREESGSHNEIEWPSKIASFPKDITEIKIALPYSSVKSKLLTKFEEYALSNGVIIKWFDKSIDYEGALNCDLQIFIDRVQNNRQIWIQNMLKSKSILNSLEKFPKTMTSLTEVTLKSASTLPINAESLIEFEKASFDEVSIAPIFRYYLYSYTRKNSPILLNISENKELYFSLNKNY